MLYRKFDLKLDESLHTSEGVSESPYADEGTTLGTFSIII